MLIPRVKKPRERSRYWLFLFFFFSLERNQGASGTPTSRRHKRTLTESRCWYTIHGTEEGRRTVREMHAYRYRFSMKRKLETHRGISSIKRDDEYGNRIYRIPSPPAFHLIPFLLLLLFLRLVRTTDQPFARTFSKRFESGNIAR